MNQKFSISRIIKVFIIISLLSSGLSLFAEDVEFPLVQSIVHVPFANYPTLGKGKVRLSLNTYYSNVFMVNKGTGSTNDMEMATGTVEFGYGLTDKITLEAYARGILAYHGEMDHFIYHFHKTFGFAQGGRIGYPENKMDYKFKDYFAYDDTVTTASPLVLGVVGRLYNSRNFHINGRVAVGIPLSSKPGFSSGKPFLGGGIIFLYKTKKFSAQFANHLFVYKSPKWLLDEDIKNRMIHSQIRLDYKWIFAGVQYKSTPFKIGVLGDDAYQMFLGVKIFKKVEFSIMEEFPPMHTTSDVTFNVKFNIISE